ncbi:hypothetical protein ACFL6C_04750 [Myxococcota bacterium]
MAFGIIAALMWTTCSTPEARASDPDLRAAIAMYQTLDYRDAVSALDRAVAKTGLSRSDRELGLAFLARAHAVLRHPAKARVAFVELLRLDPEFTIQWKESQLIHQAFERAQAELGIASHALPTDGDPAPSDRKPADSNPRPTEQVYALVVLSKDAPNPAITAGAQTWLSRALEEVPGSRVISGEKLQRRMKSRPAAVFRRCGGDLDCLAKLGTRLEADVILIGRATPMGLGSGVEIVFVRIDVHSKTIDGKVMVEIASPPEIRRVLADRLDDLLGVTELDETEGADDPTVAPAAVSQDHQPEDVEQEQARVASSEGASLPSNIPTPALVAAKQTESAVPAVASDTLPGDLATAPWWQHNRLLTYCGTGLIGVGVAVLTVGGVFGLQSKAKLSEVKRDGSLDQFEANNLYRQSDDLATRANVSFVVGGVLAGLGGGLLAFDLIGSEP